MKPLLGIIAGSGSLPHELISHCQSTGREFFVLALEESVGRDAFADVPHAVIRVGAVGAAIEQLRAAGAKELVMAGHVKRPSMFSLKPDAVGAKLLARMGGAFFGGDDALLKALLKFLEEEGFTVVGADDILGGLLAPEGVLGKIKPDAQAKKDIITGFHAAKDLGEQDLGQAAIVENGIVLGVEDAGGTDALIAAAAKKKQLPAGSGVLVKCKKPQQEKRVDLPSIGVQTVEAVHAAGFAGIALEAGGALILDKEKTIERANHLGIFLIGVEG